ncbi:unnamed protein product [Heterosigma akashiwo]
MSFARFFTSNNLGATRGIFVITGCFSKQKAMGNERLRSNFQLARINISCLQTCILPMAFLLSRNFGTKVPGGLKLVNERIQAPEVRVIYEQENIVLTIKEALQKAAELDLDLVCVSPSAAPPVCKILDHGKLLYEEKKKAKEV